MYPTSQEPQVDPVNPREQAVQVVDELHCVHCGPTIVQIVQTRSGAVAEAKYPREHEAQVLEEYPVRHSSQMLEFEHLRQLELMSVQGLHMPLSMK